MDTNAQMRLIQQNWWLMLIWGILAAFFGLYALFWPYVNWLAPIFLSGAFVLITGVWGIVLAFQEKPILPSWWGELIAGLLGLLFGLVILIWPHIPAVIAFYLVAIWAIFTGTLHLASAVSGLDRSSLWWLAIFGLATLLLGIVLFISSPILHLAQLFQIIGVYSLLSGGILLMRSFALRSLQKGKQYSQCREREIME